MQQSWFKIIFQFCLPVVLYKMWQFHHELLLSKYIILQANIIVRNISPSNLQKTICSINYVQDTLLLSFYLWDWDWLRFTMGQVLKTKVICLLSCKEWESVAPSTHAGLTLLWKRHTVLTRNMWSHSSWLWQMCDVRAQREGERSVLGMRLICPVGQVLRGAGADTINLMLRANPAFPLQRNAGNM